MLLLAHVSFAQADALRRVDNTMEKPKPRRVNESSHTERIWAPPGSGYEQPDDANDLMLLSVAFRALFFLWSVPRMWDDPTLDRYGAYPYADGPGLLRSGDGGALQQGQQRAMAVQMDAESGYLLQGVVPGSF